MTGRLDALLPDDVALAFETGGGGPLIGDETAAIAGASPIRQRDFACGRSCARRALAQLGVAPCSIPIGRLREPLWPRGMIGSITHCPSLCAAAAASSNDYLAIGIDAEVNRPLPARVREIVASEVELETASTRAGSGCWETVVFSAKESIFKAWSPHQRTPLHFSDVLVSVDPARRTFAAKIRRPDAGPFHTVAGLLSVQGDLIFTAALVRRKGRGFESD